MASLEKVCTLIIEGIRFPSLLIIFYSPEIEIEFVDDVYIVGEVNEILYIFSAELILIEKFGFQFDLYKYMVTPPPMIHMYPFFACPSAPVLTYTYC